MQYQYTKVCPTIQYGFQRDYQCGETEMPINRHIRSGQYYCGVFWLNRAKGDFGSF